MSMVEKFIERKKALDAEQERLSEEMLKRAEEATQRFIKDFESLAQSASEEEFREFMKSDDDAIDMVDRLAAIVMRGEKKYHKPEGRALHVIMMDL